MSSSNESKISGCAVETHGQENTGLTIPASLRDCYGNADLYSRNKRLPMTMTTLIELIRKVELYKGAYFDLRTLSVALLHRCKFINTTISHGPAQTSN
jgi:hypothetical protein